MPVRARAGPELLPVVKGCRMHRVVLHDATKHTCNAQQLLGHTSQQQEQQQQQQEHQEQRQLGWPDLEAVAIASLCGRGQREGPGGMGAHGTLAMVSVASSADYVQRWGLGGCVD